MKLQNSYIFVENPYKKDESKKSASSSSTTYVFQKSITNYIKEVFPSLSKVDDYGNFYKRKYIAKMTHGKYTFNTEFIITSVVETTYLDIIVEGKTTTQTVMGLEYVQSILLSSGFRENYIDIISYDAISEYYCNKMYVKLNTLERNLRKLLFNIYIVNFGKGYFDATINSEIRDKAKNLISQDNKKTRSQTKMLYNAKSNDEAKYIEYLQHFFYSLEWGDIESWLFTDTQTEYDKAKLDAFLKNNANLSELSDKELRKAFTDLSPKSDWERFFSDKIPIQDIKELIKQIRQYRNSIAHFKYFYKQDYEACKKLVNKLNTAITKAIIITEEKDFAEKNNEAFERVLANIRKGLFSMAKTMAMIAQKSLAAIVDSGLSEIGKAIAKSSSIKKLGSIAIASSEMKKTQELMKSIKPSLVAPQDIIPPSVRETQRILDSIKAETSISNLNLPKLDLPKIETGKIQLGINNIPKIKLSDLEAEPLNLNISTLDTQTNPQKDDSSTNTDISPIDEEAKDN